MKKLSENFGCWSDKLHDDDVYDCFVTIFAGVKKGGGVGVAAETRAAAKQLLEELEGKVEEARQKVSKMWGFPGFLSRVLIGCYRPQSREECPGCQGGEEER